MSCKQPELGSIPIGSTYQIVDSGKAIKCLICNMTSWHPQDIENKYCGKCHKFHSVLKDE